MPCICSICKNNLTQRPETLPPNANFVILAMVCGHIFHQCCIKKWFRVQYTQKNKGQCPVCDKSVTVQGGRRVYLQEDDDHTLPPATAGSSSSLSTSRALGNHPIPKNNCHLGYDSDCDDNYNCSQYDDRTDDPRVELVEQVTAILVETGTELEQIRAQHEELKLKYAYLASELDKFRDDLKECEIMDKVYRDNWETNVKLMSRQKEEAFSKLANIEARLQRLEESSEVQKQHNAN